MPETMPITEREREVLAVLAEGYTTEQAAAFLGITRHTARTHRSNITRKLKVSTMPAAIAVAMREGWIS